MMSRIGLIILSFLIPNVVFAQVGTNDTVINLSNEEFRGQGWNSSDIISASATIVAFFSFAFLLDIRLAKKSSDIQLSLIKYIQICTIAIVASHLFSIFLILNDWFVRWIYNTSIGITLVCFIIIAIFMTQLIKLRIDAGDFDITSEDFTNIVKKNLP